MALASIGLATACAPVYGEGYLEAVAAGKRAQHAGRFEEAATSFREAAAKATRVKDRDEAILLEARTYERMRDWRRASAAYERLLAVSPTGPRAARAKFELAMLAIDLGDDDEGYRALERAAREHPTHGLSGTALLRVLEHEKAERGDDGALAWIRKTQPAFAGTPQQQLLEYSYAKILEESGRTEAAHDAYVATATQHPYPSGPLTDDAWWRASLLAEELGRPELAIDHLRALLSPRESSHTMGSYERPRFAEAQMRIGVLQRDALQDPVAAREAFRHLYEAFPDSTLRDDALWAEARLLMAAGQREALCAVAQELAEELPQSRYAPCANRLCSTAPPPPPGRECRDYILRELEP